jgi:hypothetical protein
MGMGLPEKWILPPDQLAMSGHPAQRDLIKAIQAERKFSRVAIFHIHGRAFSYSPKIKAEHLARKAIGDTWSFYVWQIVSGEATGDYVVSSYRHTWKEVDESDQLLAGDEDPGGNVEPYLSSESESYYRYRSDVSLAPQEFLPPAKLAVTRVMLKPESVNDFLAGIKKVNAAIRKTHYPIAGATRWFQLVTGGESPQFLLLSDRANWAAFAPTTDKGLDAMMEEAYGEAQGASILRAVRSAIRSQYVETWQYREDLSFLPAPK